jgi:hypothetical protein
MCVQRVEIDEYTRKAGMGMAWLKVGLWKTKRDPERI